jgi:hypothetical protein
MRNDHAFHGFAGTAHPTPEEIARAMARARRTRSEVAHGYLTRIAAWIRGALRLRRKTPSGSVAEAAPQRPSPNASAISSYERSRLG